MFFSQEYPYITRTRELQEDPPKGTPRSVGIPGTEKPGRSRVYRAWNAQDQLLSTLEPEIRTTHDLFEVAASRFAKKPCLGRRPYNPATKSFGPFEWIDYETVLKRRAAIGAGLVELHNKHDCGKQGQSGVGLWCQNRPEWQLTDLACVSQSLFTVSIYDVLAADASEYIINHAELACVVSSLPHITTLLKLKPKLPTLKFIVSLDPLDDSDPLGYSKRAILQSIAAEHDVAIYSLDEVENLGALSKRPYNPPSPSDICTINYTSGTTGPPKGVVLTHENAISSTSVSLTLFSDGNQDHSLLSYLPLAHIYARLVEHVAFWGGARIGYFHGNILELVDDLKALKPTSFISVPRLYTRFGNAIREATVEQPGFKGALSRHIVSAKSENLKNYGSVRHALYDRIWAKKVAAALGLEKTRMMVTGSAPLNPALQNFLRVTLGVDVCQGYGMTETYAMGCVQSTGDSSTGNCGSLSPCIEACLASLPDMEYSVEDKPHPRGELLLRGKNVFKEYYKNPEETLGSMTEDGWFRTGDVCKIDEDGRIVIIDRRKNVLKLAQGEYISPERLEGVYLAELGYFAQGYIHGDSVQNFLVGVFGVQPDSFANFASKVLKQKIEPTDIETIKSVMGDDRIRKAVLADLERVAKKHKLAGYERVKNCTILFEPFTIENNLLTPTLKLKRPPTTKMYRQLLDDLYAQALAEESAPKAKL